MFGYFSKEKVKVFVGYNASEDGYAEGTVLVKDYGSNTVDLSVDYGFGEEVGEYKWSDHFNAYVLIHF